MGMLDGWKFGKFGESSVIRPTKTILKTLFIHQTVFSKIFIHPLSPKVIATKLSHYSYIIPQEIYLIWLLKIFLLTSAQNESILSY